MVENLKIQKVLPPISLTSRVKKTGRKKDKNQKRSFEEELKEKKGKNEELSVDKNKADEKTNIKKESSIKDKHEESTDKKKSKQGKLIDLLI
jgi:hypothetical protein